MNLACLFDVYPKETLMFYVLELSMVTIGLEQNYSAKLILLLLLLLCILSVTCVGIEHVKPVSIAILQ